MQFTTSRHSRLGRNAPVALTLILALAACSEPVTEPLPQLGIRAEGRLERGSVIQLTAGDGPAWLPTSAVTWTALPAAAVEWVSAGEARLLAAGDVEFTATAGAKTGFLDVEVAAPPRIVFEKVVAGNRDIWAVDLDGQNLLRLTTDPLEDRSPSIAGSNVVFRSARVSPPQVFQVPLAGGTQTALTAGTATYSDPNMSRDGARLVFTRLTGGYFKIFHSASNGTGAVRLVTDPNMDEGIEGTPVWSPDGQTVAFVSTASGNADIYVQTVGGAPRRLSTHFLTEAKPSWNPEGTRLVYIRSGAVTDLMTVDPVSGATTTLITGSGVRIAGPVWLHDGRIVFTRGEGAASSLAWIDSAIPAAPARVIPTGDGEAAAPVVVPRN